MASESTGKKPRNYYVDYTKHNNRSRNNRSHASGSNNSRFRDTPDVAFGNSGFLITAMDEVKSYLEMRNILEEYFEQIYSTKADEEGQVSDKIDATTQDELESELKHLRKNRPFKQVKTHCRNSLFINIVGEFSFVDPLTMVERLFDDLAEKRTIRSHNTFKILPILDTFRNSVSCAKESVFNILQTRFKNEIEPKKFFVEFQSRGNYKLNPEDKQKIIEGVAETVTESRPNWVVARDEADYMIVLVSLKNVCCITFLKNYFKYCKYNVIEFCKEFHVEPRLD